MSRGLWVVIITVSFILAVTGCGKKGDNPVDSSSQGEDVSTTVYHRQHVDQEKLPEEKKQDTAANVSQQTPGTEGSKDREKPKEISSVDSNYNRKYSWSFVRKKDHYPPGFERAQAVLADKYDAIYLGDTSKKTIYLTFDEGYENGYTPRILDTLKEKNVKAAFFITMPYLKKEFDLVKRMVDEGHTVGNHTVNHPSMPEVTDNYKLEQEILRLDMMFKEKTGKDMKYLRPPKGEFSERTLKISKDLGYRNVFWSLAYADWDVNNQKGAQYAYSMVTGNIHNGAVLLIHAVSRDNAEALGSIITDLQAQGYTFGTLDEFK